MGFHLLEYRTYPFRNLGFEYRFYGKRGCWCSYGSSGIGQGRWNKLFLHKYLKNELIFIWEALTVLFSPVSNAISFTEADIFQDVLETELPCEVFSTSSKILWENSSPFWVLIREENYNEIFNYFLLVFLFSMPFRFRFLKVSS